MYIIFNRLVHGGRNTHHVVALNEIIFGCSVLQYSVIIGLRIGFVSGCERLG